MAAGTDKLQKSSDLSESKGAKTVPLGPQNRHPQGAGGPSEPFTKGTRQHQEVTHAVK